MGVEINQQQLRETIKWSVDWENWTAPKNLDTTDQSQAEAGNIDTMYQLLLGQSYTNDGISRDKIETFRAALMVNQQQDGSWNACGQLPMQNRPLRETTEVTTMWTLLALQPRSRELANWDEKLANAKLLIAESQTGESSEWWAVRMLFEQQFGSKEKAAGLTKHLLSIQNDDGGWGWLVNKPSDALGTGVALFALSHQSREANEAAVRRARQFLLETQQDDGSWTVPSTIKRAKSKAKDTSNYWGTAWAVIGLIRTQPTP